MTSVTGIVTGDPRKVNVLVWGDVGNNKKKSTGCPEPSTEEKAAASHPQAPAQRQQSLSPNLSFSETE